MKRRPSLWFVVLTGLLMLAVLAPALPVRADGLMVIGGVYKQPSRSHIDVRIENRIATTTLEQTFTNVLDKQVNALYVAPVPPGATVTGFAQWIDGLWVEADVQDSAEAKAAFDEAAKKGQDAALMTGAVTNVDDPTLTFQTQVVLPPAAERSVRLTFTEVLSGEAGLTRYVYALSQTHLTSEPVGDLMVRVEIAEKDEIRAVYSPSHQDSIEIARPDATSATALYRAQNVTPDRDFELVYTQSADKFGVNVATYRDSESEDGYFVLIGAPQLNVEQTEVIAKDFVFVLDRSGSMDGPKFVQARAALKRILDALNPGDRFTIVAFDSQVESYSGQMRTLDERDSAHRWVDGLTIGGGTNISDSLLTALRTVDQSSTRPHIVVFLTDGQATEGVTETAAILTIIRESIRPQSRLYTIGIGDVNQALLEALAEENRGAALVLGIGEALEKPLNDFYAAIDSPVLVDLALDFGGIEVYDLYPNPIPDMFLGGQLVLAGRYKGGGNVTVTLTGTINGTPHTSTYAGITFRDTDTPVKATDNASTAYVPRLWAQRKVDQLVRRMNIDGPDAALIDEVKALGLKYKIVTPYTSFVVTDPDKNNTDPIMGALPGAGLPMLFRDGYREVNTALMLIGMVLVGAGALGAIWSRRR